MTRERMGRPGRRRAGAWGGSAASAPQTTAGPVTLCPTPEHRTETRNTERTSLRVGAVVGGVWGTPWASSDPANFERRKRSLPNASRSAKADAVEAFCCSEQDRSKPHVTFQYTRKESQRRES